MLIQWCLKGISEQPGGFGDPEARRVLAGHGLGAAWQRGAGTRGDLPGDAHGALSDQALSDHVNNYAAVQGNTPYLSLTAGCIERDPHTLSAVTHSAMNTALSFATRNGTVAGYVFRLWVLVAPKPAPELPGFAEEVRSLLLFDHLTLFHDEGEIAAKLFVPARQIESFTKYDANLNPIGAAVLNGDFVPPERINNVRDLR